MMRDVKFETATGTPVRRTAAWLAVALTACSGSMALATPGNLATSSLVGVAATAPVIGATGATEPAVTGLTGLTSGYVRGKKVVLEALVSGDAEKVEFRLSGPRSSRKTENEAPYYFFGDNDGEPRGWDTTGYPDGRYTLTVRVFDQDGDEAHERSFAFYVANKSVPDLPEPEPEPQPQPQPEPEPEPEPQPVGDAEVQIIDSTGREDNRALGGDEWVIPVGQSINGTIHFRNTGTGTLSITNLRLRGSDASDFRVTIGSPISQIAPGASGRLDVRFTPTEIGSRRAVLEFVTNDSDVPSSRVTLDGTGLEPSSGGGGSDPTPEPEPQPEPDPTDPPDDGNTGGGEDPSDQEPTPGDPSDEDPSDEEPQTPGEPGVILKSGSGFSGTTRAPGAIGSGFASNAKAIARWDVVPYQVVTQAMNIGVTAFHVNGIDRVEFSLNGGPWTAVHEAKLNPESGLVEYYATLDPGQTPTGKVVVRAIAYPKTGVPIVVPVGEDDSQDMVLFADAGRTIKRQVIRLGKGKHDLGLLDPDDNTWTIVEPQPGVDRRDVVIVDAERVKAGKLKLHNVTLQYAIKGNGDNCAIWLDQVDYYNPAGSSSTWSDVKDFDDGEWWTDSYVHDLHLGGMGGFIRGCTVKNIGEDPIRGFFFIADTTIQNVRDSSSHGQWHPDLAIKPEPTNTILYRVTVEDADCQGFDFGGQQFDGVALIECSVQNRMAFCFGSKYAETSYNNIYAKDCRFDGGTYFRRGDRYDGWTMGLFVIENCDFVRGKLPTNWEDEGVVLRGYPIGD